MYKLCMNLLWMERSQSNYLHVCLSVETVKVNEDNNNNHFVCCYFFLCLSLIRLFSNNIFLVLLKVFIAVIVLDRKKGTKRFRIGI